MNWQQIQDQSNQILGSGLKKLVESKAQYQGPFANSYGNYLLTGDGIHYIGEAKDLYKRIDQHLHTTNSTFHSNFRKYKGDEPNHVKVRFIETAIGRKEMEEFGIVNLPAVLNKFQLNKKGTFNYNTQRDLWDNVQANKQKLMQEGEEKFLKCSFESWFDADPEPQAGIYWLEHLNHGTVYIGESSNIYDRWKTHSGRTYFSALRRNIGRTTFGFELKKAPNGKKRVFSEKEDQQVTNFLKKSSVKIMPIKFGRFELEEFLINKYNPILNRKH